jgi:hypothetical protein
MIRQIARRLRSGVRFEVAPRGDDGGTLVARYARGDHVAFDELVQVNACVETSSHGIQRAVGGRHVAHHIQVQPGTKLDSWTLRRRGAAIPHIVESDVVPARQRGRTS